MSFTFIAAAFFAMIIGGSCASAFHPKTKICPYCRSTISYEAQNCPFCT